MLKLEANFSESDCLRIGAFLMATKEMPENAAKARDFFLAAKQINPKSVDALANIGASFINEKMPELALDPLREGLKLDPNNAALNLNYGVGTQVCLNLEDGKDHLLKALELNPPFPFEVFAGLAMNAQYRGDVKEAISYYEMALAANPGNPIGEQSLAMMLLLDRQWDRGLPLYEARLKTLNPWIPIPVPHYEAVPGATLGGKRVIIVGEQGLGDAIQFARYFKVLKGLHPDTAWIYWCDDKIADYARLFGIPVTCPALGQVPAYDVQFPLMSVMLYLHERGMDLFVPEDNPFPPVPSPHNRVGYCWRGNPNHSHDRFRSMPFMVMREVMDWGIFDQPSNVCLQADATEDEKASFNYCPPLTSWMDTVGVIQRLDAVVTVDTAVAHLAGTLGIPCYMLMPLIVDWRWGMDVETTPWYKSMRIFRQAKLGDWAPVVEKVKDALRKKEYEGDRLIACGR